MPTRLSTIVVVAILVGLVPSASAAGGGSGFFKTPSGKIVCQWVTGGSPSALVVCGVSTGLVPPIPKSGAACQHLDYEGNRVFLGVSGKTQLLPCVGDAGPFADPAHTAFLHYGRSWSAPGLGCRETTSGLTCRNRDGHGFFLSLRRWSVF